MSWFRFNSKLAVTTAGAAAMLGILDYSVNKQYKKGYLVAACEGRGLEGSVGNTPLIYMKTLSAATGCHIYAKCEFMNPTGSVKDRAALSILEAAEASGALQPGGTIVEGTGGNTGISLAQLGTARGYKVILCMAENVARAKIDYMKLLGAEVHVQPMVPFGDPRHYFQTAEAIAKECGGLFTNQFENRANYLAHFTGTGPEIYRQTERKVDIFVSASGTGGTLGGTSAFLKQADPLIQCYLADPHGSSLFNYVRNGVLSPSEGSTVAEGIGSGRITANFNEAKLDGAVFVSDKEFISMAYYLMKHEGVYIGPSAALNVSAAVKLGLQNKGSGKTIVTILCDGGDRYASKMYDRRWLEKNNLLEASLMTADISFLTVAPPAENSAPAA